VFSLRLPWDRPENGLATLEQRKRADGAPLVDLTESNPTRVDLPYPEAELRQALAPAGLARYEPAPRGLARAREAVSREHRRRGHDIAPERIVLTASSSESYAFLFKLLASPGDAILIPEPSYPLFEYLAHLEGVRTFGYRLTYDGSWQIDFASLEAAHAHASASGAAPRAVVIVSPNNPTGSCVGRGELPSLAAFCGAHGLPVISDEVFADYRFRAGRDGARGGDGSRAPDCLAAAPELCAETLVLSLGGLSKACGLPQLKLGWIVAGGPAAIVEPALARLDLIADTYLSVGTPVQLALPRLLELGAGIRDAIAERVRGNRARLVAALAPGSPCTLLEAEGGWSAIVRVPAVAAEPGAASSDESWAIALLREDDVLVHPGYLYDMPPGAYLVLGLLPRPEVFAAGIARVVARCGRFVP
jgi:aspartate/methionine/tyrosine aminotransferase